MRHQNSKAIQSQQEQHLNHRQFMTVTLIMIAVQFYSGDPWVLIFKSMLCDTHSCQDHALVLVYAMQLPSRSLGSGPWLFPSKPALCSHCIHGI